VVVIVICSLSLVLCTVRFVVTLVRVFHVLLDEVVILALVIRVVNILDLVLGRLKRIR
jgi:hypothetical protein